MKRLSAGVLVALLALSAAACGDGGDSDAKPTSSAGRTATAETTPAEESPAADAGSDKVEAYCEQIDAFVTKAQTVIESKDASKAAELSQEAGDLATAASGMTDVSAEDAKTLTDCSNKAAEALQDLATKMSN